MLRITFGGLGSFGLKAIRNRQAASSILALGSRICWVQPDLRERGFGPSNECDGDDHVDYLYYLLTGLRDKEMRP
jgi:hypothetical protein